MNIPDVKQNELRLVAQGGAEPMATATNPEASIRVPEKTYDDMLMENNFHVIANDETSMYDAIEAVPIDNQNMAAIS